MKSQIHSYRLMDSCQRLKIDEKLAERSDSLRADVKYEVINTHLQIDGKLAENRDSLRADVKYEVINTQLQIDGKLSEVKD